VNASRRARRASRRERIRGRTARLRPRDVDVLNALLRMRALRTRDIARLFFGARSTARKRLRQLFDAGLVRVHVCSLAEETRYSVSPLGYRLLEQAYDSPPRYFAPPRVDARQASHHDLLVSYWTALAVGGRENAVALELFRPEWELRSADPHAELIPDALATLRSSAAPDRPLVLAVEADTGTERAHVIQRKLERYDSATGTARGVFDAKPDAVLFVVSTERRARRLAVHLHGYARTPVLLGPLPNILCDGGLTTGISTPRQLVEQPSPEGDFTSGLLTGVE